MGKELFDAPRTNSFLFDPNNLVIIGVDTPKETAKAHPLYDERAFLPINRQLVDAMKLHGWIGSVTVCKEGETAVLCDGRQRVKAARQANVELLAEGKETIRVHVNVKRGDDTAKMGVMILSNELRTEDSVMVRAHKAARYLDTGKTEEEVALTFGVSVLTIENWMALLSLPNEVQALVENGTLGSVAASKIAILPRDKQLQAATKLTEGGKKGTNREAMELVKKTKREAKKGASGSKAKQAKTDDTKAPTVDFGSVSPEQLWKAYSDGKAQLNLAVAEALDWFVNGTTPASDGKLSIAITKLASKN